MPRPLINQLRIADVNRPSPIIRSYQAANNCAFGGSAPGEHRWVRFRERQSQSASLPKSSLQQNTMPPLGNGSSRSGTKWLNRVVQGYFNYHAVPGNLYRLAGMRSEICRAWRHALMRRSQRHRLPWDRFNRIAKRFIPPARNAHPYPEERFYASHT
jgi:hypothetical protein